MAEEIVEIAPMRYISEVNNGRRGYSLVELLMVVIIVFVIAGVAIPRLNSLFKNFRADGDAQDVSSEVSLAKMRAAASFTHARVYADVSAKQFRVETWKLLSGQSSNCWVAEGDSVCSSSYTGSSAPPENALSKNVSFGFGSLSTSPSGGTIAQGPACQTAAQTLSNSTGSVANSACIVFNSRAVPVDPTGAATTANLYLTDGSSVYGVTVTAAGLIQTWRSDASAANWKIR